MPGRDGTGPMGTGAMTGRGLGNCTDSHAVRRGVGLGLGLGLGLACRRGFKRGFRGGCNFQDQMAPETRKQLLQGQRNVLKTRLEAVDKQLENL